MGLYAQVTCFMPCPGMPWPRPGSSSATNILAGRSERPAGPLVLAVGVWEAALDKTALEPLPARSRAIPRTQTRRRPVMRPVGGRSPREHGPGVQIIEVVPSFPSELARTPLEPG